MRRRLPPDAFEVYFSLGAGRSYADVAAKFGVSKRTVTTHALRERWQDRVAERDRQAREVADKRAAESVDQMVERHMKVYHAIQRRAIEALRTIPMSTASEVVRALTMAMQGERSLRGTQKPIATTIAELLNGPTEGDYEPPANPGTPWRPTATDR